MTATLVLKLLLIGAMIAVVGTLALGLFNMFKEGKEASEKSNKVMRFRILFQALAILFFSLLIFLEMK